MHELFVRSTELRPMATQLVSNRNAEAYAAVEDFARRHEATNPAVASLAWLAIGYAYVLDHDYEKAIEPLKRAKPHAEELADYVDYFQALAFEGMNDEKSVTAVLQGFDERYPVSLFHQDCALLRAQTALSDNLPQQAIAMLIEHRDLPRADLELLLGKAYVAAGRMPEAAEAFRGVYYEMPLSPQASEAATLLQGMNLEGGTLPQSRNRAELLFKGRRYHEAAAEYRELLKSAAPDEGNSIRSSLATALFAAKRGSEAVEVLDHAPGPSLDIKAQRLYYMAEIAQSREDLSGHAAIISQLRETAPQSSWLESAFLSSGNLYLLRKDLANASRFYSELYQRFPHGKDASYSHWKAAWIAFQLGNTESAGQLFREHIELYPSSGEVPAALYWGAKLVEARQPDLARSYYRKLSQRFHWYYYAVLARERLPTLQGSETTEIAALKRIPAPPPPPETQQLAGPSDNLRLQRSKLLANAGLYLFASRELQSAQDEGAPSPWIKVETAKLYDEGGMPHRALETLKQTIPGYLSLEINSLPMSYWQMLFPRPYWEEIKKYSSRNQLDPYLVAGLIRQESEFNGSAISRANALGLMQLLPSVGKKLARQEKMQGYSTNQLLLPETNIRLGTRYFREIVEKFGGNLRYALAGYNAGAHRVNEWRSARSYRDIDEFVESIPFTETREYVQAILRNAVLYRSLYAHSDQR